MPNMSNANDAARAARSSRRLRWWTRSPRALRHLGGTRIDGVDQVPAWFIARHRKEPTGRPPGRPKGAKDSYKRAPYRKNLPAAA